MKDKAPQAQPLPRLPEKSRRNRQPPVSASRTPTANAVASARVSRRESLAERGAELWTSESEITQRGHPGRPEGEPGRSVGSRGTTATRRHRHVDPTSGGLAKQSVFRRHSLRRARGKSVCWTRPPRGGANLLAQSEGSMPEGLRKTPVWATRGSAWGYALGFLALSKGVVLLYNPSKLDGYSGESRKMCSPKRIYT